MTRTSYSDPKICDDLTLENQAWSVWLNLSLLKRRRAFDFPTIQHGGDHIAQRHCGLHADRK